MASGWSHENSFKSLTTQRTNVPKWYMETVNYWLVEYARWPPWHYWCSFYWFHVSFLPLTVILQVKFFCLLKYAFIVCLFLVIIHIQPSVMDIIRRHWGTFSQAAHCHNIACFQLFHSQVTLPAAELHSLDFVLLWLRSHESVVPFRMKNKQCRLSILISVLLRMNGNVHNIPGPTHHITSICNKFSTNFVNKIVD